MEFKFNGMVLNKPDNRPQGRLCGTVEYIEGELTEEKLANAKAKVIEDICNYIKEIPEDFFIIKTNDGTTSVGFKCFLYEDISKN